MLPFADAEDFSDVSVIVPALDEAGTIGSVVQSVKNVCLGAEVIVVDGESNDGTASIARSAGADLVISSRKGYGLAIREGLKHCRRPIAVMVDGDGTYDIRPLGEMIGCVRQGNIAVGRRFHSKPRAMSTVRYIGNYLISILLRILLGIQVVDSQSGLKAFPSGLSSSFREDGMSFSTEVLVRAKQRGVAITEVLTGEYRDRSSGSVSKLSAWRDGFTIGVFILRESIRSMGNSVR
jgi:dolichol-phosphate hexosyltransferase